MTDDKTVSLSLKVQEALTKDVGRVIARVDPEDMKGIDAEVGDIIQISGKRKTVAKVMPAYIEDRGKKIIQIDGIIRENGKVSLDEKVSIQKTSYKPASKIVLSPLSFVGPLGKDKDTKYIGRLLEGIPLVEGDRVRATLFGTRSQDFTVLEAFPPKEVVLIQPTTSIRIKSEEAVEEKGVKISYEDIGGLHKEIQRIREMIELPLKYPQIFQRLGIDAPKGVLLHGPPGCGKTLIARAVVNETDAYFVHISGPEVMGKFYGESEARLRAVFEEGSANVPSIVFIDEIDAIAPKREEMGGERQVERRVVAQLLALMDGLESRGQVIVIGATNIPNTLDPALRRPGRFDREICIGIPDKKGRLEILHIHTRGMPLAKDVDLEKLAEITHGFVGADLEALCREAAMSALRKIFPKIDFQLDEIPYELILELEVGMENFYEALKEVEPSAIREVFVEIPEVKWEEVGGLDDIKQKLKESVEWPLKYPQLFEKANTKPPKGIIIYGHPGTGKTLLAKAVAHESGINFIPIKGPALMSKYIGESEKGVREAFKKAKQVSPCILFFDEIDALAPMRGGGVSDAHVSERVISQFLTELDGIEELKGVLVLGATNRMDILDPALLRAGRFDLLLELPIPNEKARWEIFKIHTRGKPLAQEVDLKALASGTANCVGSDIEFICRRASLSAIRDYVGKDKKDHSNFEIKAKHFDQAIGEMAERKEGVK
ncbi:MAG: CDC48 family AAA ATPase [candidate division Zixibacteria bacterium]|nr:CDC48 family AAA ATPase [candidate division Zixibacteria bacterium]